jgi:gamma-glutamyltranspeptidase/glutathione hydrolase
MKTTPTVSAQEPKLKGKSLSKETRWLLGPTWGQESTSRKLELRIDHEIVEALSAADHEAELVGPFSDVMGHASAAVRHSDGLIEGAADPRSDGRAAAF